MGKDRYKIRCVGFCDPKIFSPNNYNKRDDGTSSTYRYIDI